MNSTLGDFSGNREKILNNIILAHSRDVDLVLFPEHSLPGYLPLDLLEREEFVENQNVELRKLTRQMPEGISALVGCVRFSDARRTRKTLANRLHFNSAALISKNKIERYFDKELLPTYDVFDELRHYRRGNLQKNVFIFKGYKLAVTICEDIWGWHGDENPIPGLKRHKIDLLLNLSGSPYTDTKQKDRVGVIQKTARCLKVPVVYSNLVGGQDELVFDGRSLVVDANGKIKQKLGSFVEDQCELTFESKDIKTFEVQRDKTKATVIEEKMKAIELGIRDFVIKSGQSRVHLGLSGGIDSAIVAALAVRALGKSNVCGIAIPGPYNSPISLRLAEKLAANLGIQFYSTPLDPVFESFKATLTNAQVADRPSLTQENLQARIRGTLLMAYSNEHRSLLLNTSNKSELAVGYSTLYGDQCGGLCPIGDLEKNEVYSIAQMLNQKIELIPEEIITRAPSAELRPNQKDSDSLPDYSQLDSAVRRVITERRQPKTEVEKFVLRQSIQSEFKRWQAPPIIKLTNHSFGRGRRMPVVNQWKV